MQATGLQTRALATVRHARPDLTFLAAGVLVMLGLLMLLMALAERRAERSPRLLRAGCTGPAETGADPRGSAVAPGGEAVPADPARNCAA